jgi:hypothetical protein
MPIMADQTDEKSKEIAKRFAPGELAESSSGAAQTGEYGDKNELIPEDMQNEFRRMVESIQNRDLYARITEVKRAAKGAFYGANIFDAYYSDSQDTWMRGGDQPGGHSELNYPLNIYQSFQRSFVKLIGVVPQVHFIANGPTSKSLLVAEACDCLHQDIENANDTKSLAQDMARIAFQGGRYGIYTRWVADASKYGYYDEEEDNDGEPEGLGGNDKPPTKKPRRPRGNVKKSIYGPCWLKVPINAKCQAECPWLSLGDEQDMNMQKATYPHAADRISSGECGVGEQVYERVTRISILQGIHLLAQMSESEVEMPTVQTVWSRPSEFVSIEDKKKRKWFQENYPDGAKVVFCGTAYCESANESMDKHWSIGFAIRREGMAAIPYGYSMLVLQDLYNDTIDLEATIHFRCIPAMHGDVALFDFAAYSKEPATPGAFYPLKKDIPENVNVAEHVFVEPQVQVNQQLINLRDSIPTTMATAILGISQQGRGEPDENNTTLGGISILMAASRGETGTVWGGFVEAYTKSSEQAVQIAAKYRMAEADDGYLCLARRGKPDAKVDLMELQMNDFWCVVDNDQSYPSSQDEQRLALTQLTMAAQMGDAQAKAMLEDPANAERFAQLRGIDGVKSSAGAVGAKVYQLIEELLTEDPKPNEQAILQAKMMMAMGQAQGKPVPPPNPYSLLICSRKPGPLDNATLELPFFIEWSYSPVGLRSKEISPKGYINVELYAMNLQQMAQQTEQQNMMKAVAPQLAIEKAKKQPVPTAPKSPTESIAFKDLGHAGQLQLAAQAGLDIQADIADHLTAEQMHPTPPPAPRKLKG